MEKTENKILLSHEVPTCGIFHQLRESEVREWNLVTMEDLELMEDYYMNIPFSDWSKDDILESVIAEKNRVLDKNEREEAGVDRYGYRLCTGKRRAVTNYTKPKKRKKKK